MSDTVDDIKERKRERLLEQTGEDDATTTTPDDPVHVEGADHLAQLTADHGVVLVDFHADWCGPCQQLEPIVASLAAETAATVAKVDIDRHQAIAQQHGVRGVPTLVLFSGGEPVDRVVGVQGKGELSALIAEYT